MNPRKDAIVYHDRCRDGTCGLCVVNQYLKSQGSEDILMLPGSYQDYGNILNPDLSDRHITFVDFSLYPEDMAKLASKTQKITVLDHHDGVIEQYQSFLKKDGEYLKGKFLPNVELVFDKSRSGALLAWDYLIKTPAPDFVKYISDGDLYAFALPDTKNFSARMNMENDTFSNYEQLMKMPAREMEHFLQEGKLLDLQFEQMCQKAAQKATPVWIDLGQETFFGDFVVSSVEISNRVSEILYRKNNTFAVALTQVFPDQYKLSFRSKAPVHGETSFNVQKIAQFFGGNGHTSSAGAYVKKEAFEKHFHFKDPNLALSSIVQEGLPKKNKM